MQSIHVMDVIVPDDRQRRKFDAKKMEELVQSICKPIGMLQPIVLRNDKRTLVCGERRLRAVENIYGYSLDDDGNKSQSGEVGQFRFNGDAVEIGTVPFVVLDDLGSDDLLEAELDENIRRADLTWQELSAATAALHSFRVGQDETHTIKATADEVHEGSANSGQRDEVSDLIGLAEFLDDPLIGNAKDLSQARKLVKEERKRVKRQSLAKEFDPKQSPHRLIEASSFDTRVENQFDVIITDPPYGIDAHLKDTFDSDRHEYDDSDEAFKVVCETLPSMSFTAAKDNAHLYCFADIRRFNTLFIAFELSGWTVWNRPVIWDKGNTGSYGNSDYGFRSCYEAILFAWKGTRKVNSLYRDVFNITQKTNHKHPAGKPVELYLELLNRSALPGDQVADFFAGGGTIFSAATEFGCTATGWEINEEYINLCKERLSGES